MISFKNRYVVNSMFYKILKILRSNQITRAFLACASGLFGGAMWSMDHIVYAQEYYIMAACGGLQFWAIVFMLHSAATCLLLVGNRSHRETFLINTFGVFVWGFSTVSMNVSVGRLDPSACLELLTLLLSAWVLFRTESNQLTVK